MDVSEYFLKDNTIKSLKVLHLPKSNGLVHLAAHSLNSKSNSSKIILIETCLRKIWITRSDLLLPEFNDPGLETYKGIKAYEFLLSVTTGLKSEVIGETDIFGQFKEAWLNSKIYLNTEYLNYFEMIMQKCFEDTKEIRTQFIQNIGGSSYGSILRKIISEQSEKKPIQNILVVGAGKLSKSIIPWLIDGDQNKRIKLWNRTVQNSENLVRSLKQGQKQVEILQNLADVDCLSAIDLVIYCIPEDAVSDSLRVSKIKNLKNIKVIHLGLLKATGDWNQLTEFLCLDNIFKLQDHFNEKKELWISRAQSACLERARLRALGGALTLAHGWEDLASFA